MRKTILLIATTLLWGYSCQSQENEEAKLIFSEDFSARLDTSLWKVEIAPSSASKVYTKGGQLFLDTKGGVTVWLNKRLSGNIRIEYSRKVLVDTGANDRLSDLNTFWMATDPFNKHLFTRNGVLESYDSLRMYYVGMGGNTNTTTRFRKYQGNGQRTLLKEYKDSGHLLTANKEYRIIVEVIANRVRYAVNDEIFFEYKDPAVLKEGYFGFRSTKSRQSIDWIKIYRVN